MDYNTLLKNFDELNEFIEKAHQEMQNKSLGLVEEAARRAFEMAPEIKQFHWTQYTPYFNDGEECTFSVNEICYRLYDDPDEEEDYYESTRLLTKSDLERAKKAYQEAAEYEDNKQAWREKAEREYVKRYGRKPWNVISQPYPSSRADAQEEIDRIEAFMAKYDQATVERIDEAVAKFKTAIGKIPDHIMMAVYGNHVSVVIDRDGTEIDEYEHD